MTRETRIAMLVGLLFIIMFGLVISGLTRPDSTPPKARADQAVNQRYAGLIDIVEPPPPGDTPGAPGTGLTAHEGSGSPAATPAPSASETGRAGLRVPEHPADDSTVVTVTLRNGAERAEAPSATPPPTVMDQIRPEPTPDPTPAAPAAPARKHVVKAGETLLKIARAEYGPQGEKQLALIRLANKDALKAGDGSLKVGAELVIPPLPASATVPPPATALAPAPAPSHPAPTPSYSLLGFDGLGRRFGLGSDTPAAPPAPPAAPTGPSAVGPTPPGPGPAAVRPGDAPKKLYKIRPGDSLAKIADEVMGDDSRAAVQKLYTANKSKIRDPNKLTVGVTLEIPT